MGCGCEQRRTMAQNAIAAARRGDKTALKDNLVAMGYSLKADARLLTKALTTPPPALRVKEAVARNYGRPRNDQD